MPLDLSAYRIPESHKAYYIPDFISEDEEEYILRKIYATTQPKWRQLANRRLQLLGGEIISKNVLVPQPMPRFVVQFPNVIDRLRETGAFNSSPHGLPNHIILNEYHAGQGIMPHEDGPAYHPVVATISLGSHSIFHYYKYTQEGRSIDRAPALSLLLEPRSVVITEGDLYTDHLHGIDGLETDRFKQDTSSGLFLDTGTPIANQNLLANRDILQTIERRGELVRATRCSLTCRDVAKVKRVPF